MYNSIKLSHMISIIILLPHIANLIPNHSEFLIIPMEQLLFYNILLYIVKTFQCLTN